MTIHQLSQISLAAVMLCFGACAGGGQGAKKPASPAMAGKEVKPASGASGAADAKAVVESDEDGQAAGPRIPDPIEPVNRAFFLLNDGLYFAILRPVARGYEFLIPKPVRGGIRNAFANIRFPVRFVNSLLQGRFEQAGRETGKFVVNTTAGVGGLMRASDRIPALANVPEADTGQTLAKWGIPHGMYIVWPVLGPCSLRETVGVAGDMALNPVSWIGVMVGGGPAVFGTTTSWTMAISGGHTLSGLPDQMNAYDAATKNSLEKYLAARSSWLQYREAKAAK